MVLLITLASVVYLFCWSAMYAHCQSRWSHMDFVDRWWSSFWVGAIWPLSLVVFLGIAFYDFWEDNW